MPGFNIGDSSNFGRPSNTVPVARVHRFRLTQLGSIPSMGPPYSTSSTGGGDLKTYVKEISLPTVSFDTEEVQGGAVNYKFAKLAVYDDVSITFYDTKGVLDDLLKWQFDIYSPLAGLGYASGDEGYKKDTKIQVLNEETSPIYTIVLKGSWPKSIEHSPLTYEDSALKNITVVMAYDYIEYEDMDTAPSQHSAGEADDAPAAFGKDFNKSLSDYAKAQAEKAQKGQQEKQPAMDPAPKPA